jgi:hypothetical protein
MDMTEAVDLQQCEHCDKEFPIGTMASMEDGWFCDGCMTEWLKEFEACEHKWSPEPHISVMGETCKICERCSGLVVIDEASLPQPSNG